MRRALRCLGVFRAFRAFLPGLLKTRSRGRLAFLLMCATCSRLVAVTLLAHLILPVHQFSLFGPAGCSIQKSQFFSCSRRMTTLKKSSVYLFAPDTQNSRAI